MVDLQKTLADHALWLAGEGGKQADLRYANLHCANLLSANLSQANLSQADLSHANLLSADLRCADLRCANLSHADLLRADLSHANLLSANLSGANLRCVNLSGANLSSANLRYANLSGATGLLDPAQWLSDNFNHDADGLLVFRAEKGQFEKPAHWELRAGSVLEENVHPDRCLACACGVSFATLEWLENNYAGDAIWLCRIAWMDLAGVVVPYSTDGKARCQRLTLLEQIKEGDA